MSTATDPLTGVVGVADQVRVLEEALVALGPELVPERIARQDLGRVLRSLGRIERAAGGARIVLTKAAADVGVWKAQGFRSPAEWAARANGTTVGQAAADLEASAQLECLPATRDAAASGDLSTEATKAVAAGATADRTAEADLLGTGRAGDLTGARQKARRARTRADERDGKAAERMHRRRQLRTWVEVDGEGRGQWNVPPAYQAVFLAALEPYRQEAFRQARAAGQRPSAEALMADALQLLCLDTLADLDLPVPPTPDGHPPGPTGPTRDGPDPGTTGGDAGATGSSRTRSRSTGSGPARTQPTDSGSAPDPTSSGAADTGAAAGGPGPATAAGSTPPATEPDAPHEDETAPPRLFDDPGDLDAADPGARRCAGETPSPDAPDPTTSGRPPAPEPASAKAAPTGRRPLRQRRAPAQIHFHCDINAWLRGHPQDDEVCEIPGLGPVPLTLVRAFENDATLKLVLRNGTDITAITSHRRYIPAALRTALAARDHACVVPGCHTTRGLQIDHTHDFAKGGPTALWNNALLCVFHHYLKTHCHWILRGPPGHWTFTPPDTS